MTPQRKPGEKADEAAQVFRQFAWNLAGTLARPNPKPSRRGGQKPDGGR